MSRSTIETGEHNMTPNEKITQTSKTNKLL